MEEFLKFAQRQESERYTIYLLLYRVSVCIFITNHIVNKVFNLFFIPQKEMNTSIIIEFLLSPTALLVLGTYLILLGTIYYTFDFIMAFISFILFLLCFIFRSGIGKIHRQMCEYIFQKAGFVYRVPESGELYFKDKNSFMIFKDVIDRRCNSSIYLLFRSICSVLICTIIALCLSNISIYFSNNNIWILKLLTILLSIATIILLLFGCVFLEYFKFRPNNLNKIYIEISRRMNLE